MIAAMYAGGYPSQESVAGLVGAVVFAFMAFGAVVAWAAGRPVRSKRARRGGGRCG